MAINNTLKDIREERNLIQADLAEAIGSCSQTIGPVSYTHLDVYKRQVSAIYSHKFMSLLKSYIFQYKKFTIQILIIYSKYGLSK